MTQGDFNEEAAREGGGARPARRPGHGHEGMKVDSGLMLPAEPAVENRREIPGGSYRPARTPGALGPTTRDTEGAPR
jgi:hypothetical protein